jgi:hypothetical protein
VKLILNNYHYEFQLYNTNFVDVWYNWLFSDSTQVELKIDKSSLINAQQRLSDATNDIANLLDIVNNISAELNLSNKYVYDTTNTYDFDFLQKTHEQWAQITKEANETHLPVYDHETYQVYQAIQNKLKAHNRDYNDINDAVHRIEFIYRIFYLNGNYIQKQIVDSVSSYKITPDDTSFTRDVVSLPFYDIGRPQYEKYLVGGFVDHSEISNYQNIINRIEMTTRPTTDPVDPNFILECKRLNVPQWGPYVNIAKNKYRNPGILGYYIINDVNPNNDTVILSKS